MSHVPKPNDTIREGVEYSEYWLPDVPNSDSKNHIRAFAYLWDSINPTYPFESNPFIFRYEFEYLARQELDDISRTSN